MVFPVIHVFMTLCTSKWNWKYRNASGKSHSMGCMGSKFTCHIFGQYLRVKTGRPSRELWITKLSQRPEMCAIILPQRKYCKLTIE